MNNARKILREAFDAGLAAVQPHNLVVKSPLLDRIRSARGRVVVVGAGKASAALAVALEQNWPRQDIMPQGIVVTRHGYEVPLQHIEVLTASHPHPDESCETAARRIAGLAAELTADDLMVALISGGGSSLLTWPTRGVSMSAMRAAMSALMAAGGDIAALNTVRKHLSRLAGGKLAHMANGASIAALVLSDVVGDDPSLIASGPLSADASTLADARAVFARLGIPIAPEIEAALLDVRNETPKPGDEGFARVEVEVVGADVWIDATRAVLQGHGFDVRIVGPSLEGDARELASRIAPLALQIARAGERVALVSGGEATALVRGDGEGGPNAEFALALAVLLGADPRVWALACDSDGVDGASDAAGAIVHPGTLHAASAIGYASEDALARSDATGLFKQLGDAVVCGPTMTNVNDIRIVLINP